MVSPTNVPVEIVVNVTETFFISECEHQKHKETIKNCARFVAVLLYRLFYTLEVYLIVVGGGWTFFMGGWRYILGG